MDERNQRGTGTIATTATERPLVLHANWTAGRLWLWAESPDLWARVAPPEQTHDEEEPEDDESSLLETLGPGPGAETEPEPETPVAAPQPAPAAPSEPGAPVAHPFAAEIVAVVCAACLCSSP